MTSMRELLPPDRAIPDERLRTIKAVLVDEAGNRENRSQLPSLTSLQRFSVPPVVAVLLMLGSVGAGAYVIATYSEDIKLVAPPAAGSNDGEVALGSPDAALARLCNSSSAALGFAVSCPTSVPAGAGAELRPPRCIPGLGSDAVPQADPQAGRLECYAGDWFLLDLTFPGTTGDPDAEGVIVISAVPSDRKGGERLCASRRAIGPRVQIANTSAESISCARGSWDYGEGPWESLRWVRGNVTYEVTAGLGEPGPRSDALRELVATVASTMSYVEAPQTG